MIFTIARFNLLGKAQFILGSFSTRRYLSFPWLRQLKIMVKYKEVRRKNVRLWIKVGLRSRSWFFNFPTLSWTWQVSKFMFQRTNPQFFRCFLFFGINAPKKFSLKQKTGNQNASKTRGLSYKKIFRFEPRVARTFIYLINSYLLVWKLPPTPNVLILFNSTTLPLALLMNYNQYRKNCRDELFWFQKLPTQNTYRLCCTVFSIAMILRKV